MNHRNRHLFAVPNGALSRGLRRCDANLVGWIAACLLAAPINGSAQQTPSATQNPKNKATSTQARKPSPDAAGLPELNKPVPAFTLPDTDGHQHRLAELKGRSVALYFFCGCERCQKCAQAWGQLQRGGALAVLPASAADTAGGPGNRPTYNTVIVFMGDAADARSFAETNGLDTQQTLLLLDPKMEVTRTYRALPCPRAFALDAQQKVRYVNSHKDDDPLKASAATIVTRTLEALTNAKPPNPPK